MTLITQHFDSVTADIMRLNYIAQDVSEGLHEQSRYLKMRDIGVPELILQEVASLSTTLRSMAERLEEQQTELAQLRALAKTTQLINSSLDLESVLARAMDTVIGLTDAERAILYQWDRDKEKLEVKIARGIEQVNIQSERFTVSHSIIESVIQTGQAIVTANARDDERFSNQDSVMSYDLRSILCVPLIYRGRVVGVVYADNRIQNALFGERELQLLMTFANQAVIAIQNAQLFEQVKASLDEVTEMQRFLDSIFSSIASGVVTTDREGNIRTCNSVAEKLLGVSASEVIGEPLMHVFPPIYEGFENMLNAVQERGSLETLDVNVVMPHIGRPMNLSLKISPLKDADNNTIGTALVLDDLTELKQRDETLNVVRTYLPPEMVRNIESLDKLGLGGEEREISVIFGDVRGFTTFSEKLEPELLMEIINKYLSTSSVAIQLLGGIIDKYMGDAVVGLYNTQLNPQENHAELAVRAAMAIINDVDGLHSVLPEDQRLFYGLGVHTGKAMLGNVGSPSRKEFTALGDATTFAKKLQEIAQGGEVIISQETYEQVKDIIQAELTERPLRGSGKIVKVYKVIDVI